MHTYSTPPKLAEQDASKRRWRPFGVFKMHTMHFAPPSPFISYEVAEIFFFLMHLICKWKCQVRLKLKAKKITYQNTKWYKSGSSFENRQDIVKSEIYFKGTLAWDFWCPVFLHESIVPLPMPRETQQNIFWNILGCWSGSYRYRLLKNDSVPLITKRIHAQSRASR